MSRRRETRKKLKKRGKETNDEREKETGGMGVGGWKNHKDRAKEKKQIKQERGKRQRLGLKKIREMKKEKGTRAGGGEGGTDKF